MIEIDLSCDFETRSAVDLKLHGLDRYFDCPHADVLIGAYRINGEPAKVWLPGQPCPYDIVGAMEAGAIVSAHNCQFERTLWRKILTPRYGWPELPLERCRCTAATAAALGLPRDLDGLGKALNLAVQKDDAGKKLIKFFCVPVKTKDGSIRFNQPADHPALFRQFIAYCVRDVDTEYAADQRMMPLAPFEQDLWLLDQQINDRGMPVDLESIDAALQLAQRAKLDLDRKMAELTDNAVTTCGQVAKLREWANAQLGGAGLPSLGKADVVELLDRGNPPPRIADALNLRLEAAKASVSKLEAFRNRTSADGRLRHAFLYHAAGTGRWSSLGVQLHNLPRPRKAYEEAKLDLDTLFDAIRKADPRWLAFLYGEELGRTLHLLADALRSFIKAPEGQQILAADYSNIEGVVAAWFAGEEWKLKAFREIFADPDHVPDLYRRAAAGIFGTTVEAIDKKDPRRQVGKVAELSMQYQGGPGALASMARNYLLHLDDAFPFVWEAASQERRDKALARYEACCERNEHTTNTMSREAWLAAELVKVGWRASNPEIAGCWKELENAAREAVMYPGRQVDCYKVSYKYARGFLWCRLPSGRCLAYGSPRLKPQVWAARYLGGDRWADAEVMDRDAAEAGAIKGLVRIEGETSAKVTVLGVDSQTRRFVRYALYGGLAFENIVQAIARDILANGLRHAHTEGYYVIGHVHDEIIALVKQGFSALPAFLRVICRLPKWCSDMPLSASGYVGPRYMKG